MVDFKVDISSLKNYKMADSDSAGPATLLAFDGPYQLLVNKAAAQTNEDNTARWLGLTMVVQNDPKGQDGSVLYHNIFPDGEVKHGDNAGLSHAKRIIDVLTSAGLEADANRIIQSGTLDIQEVAGLLQNKTIYARMERKVGKDGVPRSEPRFFIRQARYEDARKSGVNFRVAPSIGGTTTTTRTPTNGAMSKATVSATDALNTEV